MLNQRQTSVGQPQRTAIFLPNHRGWIPCPSNMYSLWRSSAQTQWRCQDLHIQWPKQSLRRTTLDKGNRKVLNEDSRTTLLTVCLCERDCRLLNASNFWCCLLEHLITCWIMFRGGILFFFFPSCFFALVLQHFLFSGESFDSFFPFRVFQSALSCALFHTLSCFTTS